MLLFQDIFPVLRVCEEFCILLSIGFCVFWFISWSVGQNATWMNEAEISMVTWLVIKSVCTFFILTEKKKIHKAVSSYSTDRPLTHMALSIKLISTFCTQFQIFAQKHFNFLHSLGLIDVLSVQWACWKYCTYIISISIIRNFQGLKS